MNLPEIIRQFRANAQAINAMLDGIDATIAHRRPDVDRWSIVEIVGHLADEEREDFRKRIDLTLHSPEQPWPGLNPEGRVRELDFISRPLPDTLADFTAERARSLTWLASLDNPDWDLFREHPVAGRLTAGDLLASWLAHDLLHIRQIARTLWEHIPLLAPGRDVEYAGPLR